MAQAWEMEDGRGRRTVDLVDLVNLVRVWSIWPNMVDTPRHVRAPLSVPDMRSLKASCR